MPLVIPGVEVKVVKEVVAPQLSPSGILGIVGITQKAPREQPVQPVQSFSRFVELYGANSAYSMPEASLAFANGVAELIISPIGENEANPSKAEINGDRGEPAFTLTARARGSWGNQLSAVVTRRKTPDGNDVFDLEIKRGKDTLELLRNREIPSDIGSQLVTVDWGSGGLPVANEKNTSTPFRDGSDASADAYEKAIEALANHREVDMVLAALQDMSDVSKVARVYSSVISHCQNMSAISQGRIGFGQTPPALAKAKAVAKAAEAETAAEIAKDAALAEAAAKIAEAKAVARAAEAKTAAKTAKDAADKANADAAAAKAETDAKISKDAADKDAAAKANADAEAAKDAAAKANADAEAAKAAADKAKAVAETAKDAAAKAAAVSEHTDIKDWSDLADKLRSDRFVLLAPWGTAGAVAGMVGSLDYFQSPTFKKVAGLTDLSARLLVDEQKSLLENKVVPVANMRDSGTIVVQGLTTDGDQISVRRVADRAVRGVKLVGNLFIGRLNNEIGRGALKQKLAEFLMEMERAGAIVPSTDGKQPAFALDVYSTQSDFAKGIVSVNLAVRPVRAIDYIYATVLVQV